MSGHSEPHDEAEFAGEFVSAEVEPPSTLLSVSDRDADRLRGVDFASASDDAVEALYEDIDGPEVAPDDSYTVEELKRAQKAQLASLGRDDGDEEAVLRDRIRGGQLHAMADVPLADHVGLYAKLHDAIVPELVSQVVGEYDDENVASAVEEVADLIGAVTRASIRDVQLAVDAYEATDDGGESDEIAVEAASLRETLESDVRPAVEELGMATGDIAENADEINALTASQSRKIRKLSNETADLSATTEEIAASTEQVNTVSDRAEALAEDGLDHSREAIEEMHRVEDARTSVESDFDALRENVERIDDVVAVINDIADQTNVLALNASIEAARAGEAGSGFAVVAEEVKELAEETQSHADDIETMIAEVQQYTDDTMESLDETGERVERGAERVESAMETLQEVGESIAEVSHGIDEVADATDQQAASAEEVATMIDEAASEMSDVSSGMETITASNEELSALVNGVQVAVDSELDE
ncbi:globin-coupled sensor protein [Halorussus salilacus]|uniref:globin-coupled sensor protein n=1 Tax=Halorussus salilacus TaxID=2953750 RepID=UPI0020A2201C|nr:globin-coupled sensor protein [Halorussus salilacus]USZ67035.1 globin-coupled sensor protein [Halorussus salilacus]